MNNSELQEIDINVNHYLEVLLRRRWIMVAITTIIFLSTALYTFTTRPVFEAQTLLVIEKERSAGNAYVSANGAFIEASNEDYYQTQYRLLKSESLLEKVYRQLQLQNTSDFSEPDGLGKLASAVTVAPVLRSRLVNVKVQSHSPSLAALVSETLSQQFVEDNLANQLFISKEVLQALQIKADDPQARRLHESLPAVVTNPLIQNLKAEYAKLQSQAADLSGRYTEKHPLRVSIASNMAALQAQIRAETDKVVQSMKTELSGQLKGNNVRVVDPAKLPTDPIKPRKFRNLAMGLISGFLLAFMVSLFVETLDQTVRTQEDVEVKLNRPYIGIVPFAHQKTEDRVYDNLLAKEPSLSSESMRNIRTLIDFAGITETGKHFLVTSSVQSEGKTYVASNIGVAFAQLGEKVLLVDGDLRRPRLHRNFHISTRGGISDFLATGKSTEELEGLIQAAAVPNLSVLACGTRPPNPSELLNTPRLGAALAWAKAHFDRIVIDCTPMFPIHDTLLWGKHIPAALFVVRYGTTRIKLVHNACDRMKSGGIKLLGIAINAAKPSGLTYTAYGSYYHQYYNGYEAETASGRQTG